MKEKRRKILIFIGLVISCVYAISQFIYFFEEGPSGGGLSPLLLIATLIGTILLSKKYFEDYFKSKQVLTCLTAFMALAIILDNFYELAFQLGEPIHPILWIDLVIRSVFFIPWIHMWIALLYYFNFSVKQAFYLAGLQGILGEYFILWAMIPQNSRFRYYISLYGPFSLIMIPIDWFLVIVLYGCNIAVPYSLFRETFKEHLNPCEVRPIIKYTLSFIPLLAFPIGLFIIQNFLVHIIIAFA